MRVFAILSEEQMLRWKVFSSLTAELCFLVDYSDSGSEVIKYQLYTVEHHLAVQIW